jgi:hypothetical protein
MSPDPISSRPVDVQQLVELARSDGGRAMWSNLRAYCLFLGYSRSGHSAVGSAIDAHPMAAISHELNALGLYFRHAPKRELLLLEIYLKAVQQAREGRMSDRADGGAYDQRVTTDNTHVLADIQVIGDKKGAGSTVTLARVGHARLSEFSDYLGLPVKVLHVLRNPYDMVAASLIKAELDQGNSFLKLSSTLADLRHRYQGPDWLDVYLEDVIADPRGQMARILEFLGLPVLDRHLAACDDFFFDAPHRRRQEVAWPDGLKARVQRIIDSHDYLQRYTWDD